MFCNLVITRKKKKRRRRKAHFYFACFCISLEVSGRDISNTGGNYGAIR